MRIKALLIFTCLISSILLVESVLAVWVFPSFDQVNDVTASVAVDLVPFEYSAEEILPGGSNVAAPIGENHLLLIWYILNVDDYGLNKTKKPIIHNYLKKPGDVVYCDQQTSGGQLKHVMAEIDSNTERLYFIVTEISDTHYDCYTMRYSDITNKEIGTLVDVYRTALVYGEDPTTGEVCWHASTSEYGKAPVIKTTVAKCGRAVSLTSWVKS